jgi:hypothetical protein
MDPATISLIVKKILMELIGDTDKLVKVVIGAFLFVLFIFLFIAAPLTLRNRVPIVSSDIAFGYVNAAEAVSASTKSPCNDGVVVDWQQVIAIDAVRLNQDFRKSTPEEEKQVAQMFVEKIGTCKQCSGSGKDSTCNSYPTYKLLSLDEVAGKLGLNIDDVKKFLNFDLSFLVYGDVAEGAGAGDGKTYTSPQALQYKAVNADAIIAYLQKHHSALANANDVNAIIVAAKAHGLNPLLLIAITGQEQSFDDTRRDTPGDVYRIEQNPFNVGGSWQTSHYPLSVSSEIVANFLAERLSKAPPGGENAIEWINDKNNHSGGLYASLNGSPTPGWWEGVNGFFNQMSSLPGVYTEQSQQ